MRSNAAVEYPVSLDEAIAASHPDWKDSKYNVQVEWETAEITYEPLSIIAADDPVTCAPYDKENDLLALEGWHRFRNLAKTDKVLVRAINTVRSDKSGDPNLHVWVQETTWRPCNLGRFDLHAQVATMSRFRAAPRQGHMDRLKRIYSYAIRTKDYAIRFRTDQPDYSFIPDQDFTGHTLYMVMSKKSFLMTCQNHLARL